MTGLELIAAERQRQIDVEGWTPEHDAEHSNGELIQAAACYALSADGFRGVPTLWPFARQWWKPSNPIRDLAKAGALIAAEIDRLQRRAISGEVCSVCGTPGCIEARGADFHRGPAFGSVICDYSGTPPFADAEWASKEDALCLWCAGTGHPYGDEAYGMCRCPSVAASGDLSAPRDVQQPRGKDNVEVS